MFVNSNLGDISNIKTSTLNSVAKLLQYWIDNGELSNPNSLPLVPKMTSATTPSGIVSASSQTSGREAYHCFDGTATPWEASDKSTLGWVKYKFDTPKVVSGIMLERVGEQYIIKFDVLASNDDVNYVTLKSFDYTGNNNAIVYGYFNNSVAYSYYKVQAIQIQDVVNGTYARNIQFYGHEM